MLRVCENVNAELVSMVADYKMVVGSEADISSKNSPSQVLCKVPELEDVWFKLSAPQPV